MCPYIKSNDGRREALQKGDVARNAGELNYQIFYYVKKCGDNSVCYAQIIEYVNNFIGDKPNYQRYNDMTGALIRCSKEIERRLGFNLPGLIDIMESYDEEIANYEDLKILENGEV